MATDDPNARPNPTRLELAREIEALRLAVREREGWIDGLRRELEERDASFGWRDQEAKTAAVEAAAARREATQFREDRDHARRQLHLKNEELAAAATHATQLEAVINELRVERRRRKEELLELRGQAESASGSAPASAALDAERAQLERQLLDTQADLKQARETLQGLADELAAVQEEAAREGTAALAGRTREIELLQRLSAQGDELAVAKAEVEQLDAVLSEERRTADARLDTLHTELLAARMEADKSTELSELARLRDELATLHGETGLAPNADLAARDARLAELARELADKSARLTELTSELQELRSRGFARYLEGE